MPTRCCARSWGSRAVSSRRRWRWRTLFCRRRACRTGCASARAVRGGARRPAGAGAALPREVVSGSAGAAGGGLLLGAGCRRVSRGRSGRRGGAAGVCRGGCGRGAVRRRDERRRRAGGGARAVLGADLSGSRAARPRDRRRSVVAARGLRAGHPAARGERCAACPGARGGARPAVLRVGDDRRVRGDAFRRPDVDRPRALRQAGRGAGVRDAGGVAGDLGRAGHGRRSVAARARAGVRGDAGRDHAGGRAGPAARRGDLRRLVGGVVPGGRRVAPCFGAGRAGAGHRALVGRGGDAAQPGAGRRRARWAGGLLGRAVSAGLRLAGRARPRRGGAQARARRRAAAGSVARGTRGRSRASPARTCATT